MLFSPVYYHLNLNCRLKTAFRELKRDILLTTKALIKLLEDKMWILKLKKRRKFSSVKLVDRAGVEPAVSAMRMRRITNCANGPIQRQFIIPENRRKRGEKTKILELLQRRSVKIRQ